MSSNDYDSYQNLMDAVFTVCNRAAHALKASLANENDKHARKLASLHSLECVHGFITMQNELKN